jgi:uncharacterized protein involved in tolerance to divalent cations
MVIAAFFEITQPDPGYDFRIYLWQGNIGQTNAVVVVAQDPAELFKSLAVRVRALHHRPPPSSCRSARQSAYLDWLAEATV